MKNSSSEIDDDMIGPPIPPGLDTGQRSEDVKENSDSDDDDMIGPPLPPMLKKADDEEESDDEPEEVHKFKPKNPCF